MSYRNVAERWPKRRSLEEDRGEEQQTRKKKAVEVPRDRSSASSSSFSSFRDTKEQRRQFDFVNNHKASEQRISKPLPVSDWLASELPLKEIVLFANLLPICQNHVGGDDIEQQLHQSHQHHATIPFFLIEVRANRQKFEEELNTRFFHSNSATSYELQQKNRRTNYIKWVLQHKKNRGIAKFLVSSVQERDEYKTQQLYNPFESEPNEEQQQNDLLLAALVDYGNNDNDNDSNYRQYDGDLDLSLVTDDTWSRTAARVSWELLFCLMRNVFCHEAHFEWSWVKSLALETEKLFGSLEFLVDAFVLYETTVVKPLQEASKSSTPDNSSTRLSFSNTKRCGNLIKPMVIISNQCQITINQIKSQSNHNHNHNHHHHHNQIKSTNETINYPISNITQLNLIVIND